MRLDKVIAVRTKKTVYRDGDRCIKVFHEPYSKAAIFTEASNHVRLEEAGLNVPRVLEVTTYEGEWAIVTEHIKGKTLEQLMKEHPENKESYYRTLADLQSSIHKKDCPYLHRLQDELNHKISISELDATVRFDLHNRLERMAKGTAICHGDFSTSNVILADNGIYYTLDWALVSCGNPLADVAQTYIMIWLNNSYDEAELYLDMYCSESVVDKDKVYEWLPILGAAMSVRRPLNERTILLECVNSLDFKNHMKKFI